MDEIPIECELCGRETTLTKHHLIPRTRHKNKKNKKNFTRSEIHERVLWICRPCHNTIHDTLSTKELEYDYNTRETLMAHPKIAKFVAWVKDKPPHSKVKFDRKQHKP